MKHISLLICLMLLGAGLAVADGQSDRQWENPVFADENAALAAARALKADEPNPPDPARRFFLAATLGSQPIERSEISGFLLSHPKTFLDNQVQRSTIDRFTAQIPRQQRKVEKRLERFGYPDLEGLVYLQLVDNTGAFAGLNADSSDRMSQVGGVTYFCRYLVLPLSYVSEQNLQELRRSAALNPNLDVDTTVRQWQAQSFTNLVNTFRHELVHVHTNTALGLPIYSSRSRFPTWFHEGTATYLSGDPRSGLSTRYQEYQQLFFYLAQRFGIPKLHDFYRTVLAGEGADVALTEVYDIGSSDQLFESSSRWYRGREIGKNVFWIAVLGLLGMSFRRNGLPVIAILLIVLGVFLGMAILTGFAEHLWGLQGATIVGFAKATLWMLVLCLLGAGGWRLARRRH